MSNPRRISIGQPIITYSPHYLENVEVSEVWHLGDDRLIGSVVFIPSVRKAGFRLEGEFLFSTKEMSDISVFMYRLEQGDD